ncbi:hypothetical protein PC116_g29559 [Phytophthora cactorum]|nr:hypothetical protein PC116_g29559 [Phytophthora cactorum]
MLFSLPLRDWHGFTADLFTQFTQYLVVLFRLLTLDEPGWDPEEVRRRADVFAIIDRACLQVDRVPIVTGMVDAEGPRSGFFFKMSRLLRDVRTLFVAEMASHSQLNSTFSAADSMPTSGDDINNSSNNVNGNNNAAADAAAPMFGEEMSLADEIYLNTVQEDILAHVWDFRPDATYMPFAP